MKIRIGIVLLLIFFGCKSSNPLKKEWSVAEVQTWYNEKHPSWEGLLYRGSDKKMHHFISRVRDEWHIFNIQKSLLTLADERPLLGSTGAIGYYFVDPNKNFEKIRDY